jgi:peptidoglycan/LPS O-acetylase OafA/YrhL
VSRRDYWAIAAIWVVVLVGAFLLAALTADDNPNTDEGAGAGVLAAIVGGLLTGVYLLIRETRARREKERIARSSGETERIVVPKTPRLPRPREWWVDVVGAIILWIVGTVIALQVVGLNDDLGVWIGGLLPLAFLLMRHLRRTRSTR